MERIRTVLAVLVLTMVSTVAVALPILSPDGSQLSGLQVDGYGVYDVVFGDGVVGNVYAGVVFDIARHNEANAVSASIAQALNALLVLPAAVAGCNVNLFCYLFNPDSHPASQPLYLSDYNVLYASNPTVPQWGSVPLVFLGFTESTARLPGMTLVRYKSADAAVPVPGVLALFALGLAGMGLFRRRCNAQTCPVIDLPRRK